MDLPPFIELIPGPATGARYLLPTTYKLTYPEY